MNDTQRSLVRRILIGAASVLLIFYIVYQAYMIIHNPVGTELAYEYTLSDSIAADVFVARDEAYIVNHQKGTIIPAVEDGSRVSKSQEIAHIFIDNDAADTYSRIRELDEQIERYTRLAQQSDNYTFNVSDLETYIEDEAVELVKLVADRNLSQLDTKVNDLRNRIVTKQISTGNRLDFDTRLSELQSERNRLALKSTAHRNIIASESGYFISGADGFEKTIDCKEIKNITSGQILDALKAEPGEIPEGTIGRIVQEFNWYFLCVVEARQVAGLAEGREITVNLPYSAVNTLKAKVYKLNENQETGEVALVLSCNLMNPGIASLRHETAEIVISTYTGLKIPASAIRMNDEGEKGVYVLSGNIAKFRKINIIYATDDYVLSRTEEGQDGYVRLYDNIITEGKDLYDGKVIK